MGTIPEEPALADRVAAALRDVPDWPQPGVAFKDITPLLRDGALLADTVAELAGPWRGEVDAVAGLEARGFIFAAAVAVALGVGLVPVRKAGKLPSGTVGLDYDLEYGSARVEVHDDALAPGERVLVVDDVLATGGTAGAACALLERVGAHVVGVDVVVELAALDGRRALAGRALRAVVTV